MRRCDDKLFFIWSRAAWNTVYLSQAVEELKKRGEVIPEEYLPLSP
jgi:hypothetical protein